MVPERRWIGKGPGGRVIEIGFDGGCVTSDGGVLALGAIEARLGLLKRVMGVIADPRDQQLVEHSLHSMLCQRVFGICLGYEDLNDHTTLRGDIAFQTAAKREEALASAPTLCRMENWANRDTAWGIHRILLDIFLDSFSTPPAQIVLDFDATDDRVHGSQAGRYFNAYYDEYVFLPLHVYCGERLLVSYLRPGCSDGALHAGAILRILVREIRARWPKTKIVFRADSGFCRKHILGWCERNHVAYIVGLPQNQKLNKVAQHFALRAQYAFEESGTKSRVVDSFFYSAGTWKDAYRKVIARVEYGEKGVDFRYVVTNIQGKSKELYEILYCARGNAENHIKDVKLTLFSDRTSCVDWDANQFRLLLSTLAYTFMEYLRREGLGESDPEFSSDDNAGALPFPRTSMDTIRLRFLKIGAVITRNTRRIIFKVSSAFPLQDRFLSIMARLVPA